MRPQGGQHGGHQGGRGRHPRHDSQQGRRDGRELHHVRKDHSTAHSTHQDVAAPKTVGGLLKKIVTALFGKKKD